MLGLPDVGLRRWSFMVRRVVIVIVAKCEMGALPLLRLVDADFGIWAITCKMQLALADLATASFGVNARGRLWTLRAQVALLVADKARCIRGATVHSFLGAVA